MKKSDKPPSEVVVNCEGGINAYIKKDSEFSVVTVKLVRTYDEKSVYLSWKQWRALVRKQVTILQNVYSKALIINPADESPLQPSAQFLKNLPPADDEDQETSD